MSRISWRGALHALSKSESAKSRQVVEAAVYWNGTCIQSDQIPLDGEKPVTYKIGESPECRFMVDSAYIHSSEYVLLEAVENQVLVRIPAMSSGEWLQSDTRTPIASREIEQTVRLDSGVSLDIHLGPWTFTFSRTATEALELSRFGLGFLPNRWTYVSVALHAVFFMLVAMMPPEVSGMNIDDQMQNSRIFRYMILATEQPPVQNKVEAPKENPTEGNAGKAQAGPTGKAGDRNVKSGSGRMGIIGPPDTKNPKIGKEILKQMMNTQGVLALMTPTITSPFGEGDTIGRDPENVLSGLIGDHIGPEFGVGGMGPTGSGRGGGGDSTGTIGVGDNLMADFGHDASGNCVGSLCGASGWRTAHELKDKNRRTRVPDIRVGTSTVAGSLSKDVIRRHIHRRLAQIRFCYEKELAANPSLSGRVSVMFMISATGAVRSSSVAQSTIGSTAVESCIANVVKNITFPVPKDGGNVIVTYPFTLVQSGM